MPTQSAPRSGTHWPDHVAHNLRIVHELFCRAKIFNMLKNFPRISRIVPHPPAPFRKLPRMVLALVRIECGAVRDPNADKCQRGISIHMMHKLELIGKNWIHELTLERFKPTRHRRVGFMTVSKVNECIQFLPINEIRLCIICFIEWAHKMTKFNLLSCYAIDKIEPCVR